MNTAVISSDGAADTALQKSEGVWAAAWRRFKGDKVGLGSAIIVIAFLVLIVLAAFGLVAKNWQAEIGVPNAPPSFMGPAPKQATGAIDSPTGPNVDLSAVDPLAPRYQEWDERAKQFQTTEVPKAETLPLGGDRLGRDVLAKAIKGTEISVFVGLAAALSATVIGTLLGAFSGYGIEVQTTIKSFAKLVVQIFALYWVLVLAVYALFVILDFVGLVAVTGLNIQAHLYVSLLLSVGFTALLFLFGGRLGDLLEWIYNVFESIPNILLIFAFAAVVGRGVGSVVIILALTGWTGMYRQVRAEFIKHRSREYVRSAEAIGASNWSRMFKHILPNVSHVVLVRMSLLTVGFIKAEVILSYLGLGVRVDQVSWGTMLAEAQSELILGHWWQLAAATLFMAVFVTAFSLMADALRDALDPKLRGLE